MPPQLSSPRRPVPWGDMFCRGFPVILKKTPYGQVCHCRHDLYIHPRPDSSRGSRPILGMSGALLGPSEARAPASVCLAALSLCGA